MAGGRPKRKAIPIGTKLESALLALGYTLDEIRNGGIEWDHCPALRLRFVDPETGDLVPAANDPRYIRPMRKTAHDRKTNGPGGEKRITSYGSDQHAIAKIDRVARADAEHRAAMARKGGATVDCIDCGPEGPCYMNCGPSVPVERPPRPKARIASRGFDKTRRRKMNGKTERRT